VSKEVQGTDISNIPEMLRLAEEVRATRTPRVLKRGDEEIAVVAPVESPATRRRRKEATPPARPNAWLEQLIGIGSSEGAGDVSANKHKYLAEAYYAESHKPTER
jgi:hypothetical protein